MLLMWYICGMKPLPIPTQLLIGALFAFAALHTANTVQGCHKEPTTAEQLLGLWKQTTTPYAYYQFTNGRCIRQIIDLNTEIWRNEYAYTVDGDNLNVVELLTGQPDAWHVTINGSSATIQPASSPLQITLKRFPQ